MATAAKAKQTSSAKETSLESVFAEVETLLKRHAPPFKASGVGSARSKKSIELTVPKPVVVTGAYDGALRKDIETALDLGAKVYKERGWI